MLAVKGKTVMIAVLAVAVLVCSPGCRVVAGPQTALQAREAIYAAATNRVAKVVLYKPASPPEGLAGQAAPLFMVETDGTNGSPLVVEWVLSTAVTGDQNRPAVEFTWRSPAWTNTARGLRVILGSDGLPIVWEALDARSELRIFYVSKRIEARAAQDHGAPLKGRRYASEPEPANVVVARVLDDAPVLMGPIIYLRATGEMTAVICRCMPAQADTLAGTHSYSFQPATQNSAPVNIPLRLPKAL